MTMKSSLALITGLMLCVPVVAPAQAVHDHGSKSRYGGTQIVLGDEEYHAEIALNEKQNVVTVYLLDSSAAKPIAIPVPHILINLRDQDRPRQYRLIPVSMATDPTGSSSRFVIQDAELLRLLHLKEAGAHLRLPIGTRSYSGKLDFSGHQH